MKKMGWADVVVLLLKLRAVIVLLALLIMFSAMAPSFLTANNLSILAKHVAISALLSVGMTFVVLAGGIDLSVGSVAGLSGMVAGGLLTVGLYGHPVGALVAVVGGTAGEQRCGIAEWSDGYAAWGCAIHCYVGGRCIFRAARRSCCRMGRRFRISRRGIRALRGLGRVFWRESLHRCGLWQ